MNFYKFNDKLQNFGAYISSLLFLSLVILISLEIILRSFFNVSTMIAGEYSGYLYLSAVFFGLGYTFKEDGHIRITLITSKFATTFQRWIDVLAGVITLCLVIFILYHSIFMIKESYEYEMVSETVSETPIYLTQLSIPIGLLLFLVAIFSYILKRIKSDK